MNEAISMLTPKNKPTERNKSVGEASPKQGMFTNNDKDSSSRGTRDNVCGTSIDNLGESTSNTY